ncbi:PREDICTED: uncharacterized protein LOC109584390 [Amphimedon queenslandica]|uniref:Protein kinase domain-containing protein n=1 Tax=Amphimedon queenslandica TaxID=400682 RepID=A0A1X7U8L6_AMPQE|nr:PREDICTED: uncharacterized protein LOC109584390 [Amphimedon queenslandica]|eukprot:XP_019855690.1 PREDICTED: uncharacterized protein LOC109584390 [Amphimedon queenslandica]
MSDHRPLNNFDSGIGPSIVKRIQYDITKSEAGCGVPPLTYSISPSSSFQAAYTNMLSDLALVLSNPRTMHVSGTNFNIEIPNLMDDHILIVFPPALPNTDPTTLIVHIYAIEISPDHLLTSKEISSCLNRLDQSSPLYKSLVNVDYKLGVYRLGEGYDTKVLQTGEYNAGSILYLIESSNDEASGIILRGSAPGQYLGAHCVAVLSSNGPVPFSDSRMDEELTLTEERKEESNEEELVAPAHDTTVKRKGMEEENISLEPRETLSEQYHTVDEKETSVQQKDELTVTHLSISNPEGGIVLLQNPSPIPSYDITELSFSNRTPSYSPSAPISDTNKKLVYPTTPSLMLQQKEYFTQPSISPHKQITRDLDLPESIKKKNHGALIYAQPKGFVEKLFSGHFSALPKCEDLAQYDQLGKGGNGEVISSFFGGHKVALKYVKTGYRRETLAIWSKLDHPNIIPLLGAFVVHSVNQQHYCQVMPRMTRSLRDEFKVIGGGIIPALKLKEITAMTLWRNFQNVCRQVLLALDYLQKCGIALLDLKSSNMLTMQEHCQCKSIFQCLEGHRYSVKLADFDFVHFCSSTFTKCPKHPIKRKDDEELCRISGTPEYRVAPERACKDCGCEGVNVIGPWNDVWSFGVFLLDELRGRFDKNDTTAEAKMLSGDFKGNSSRFDPNNCSYTAEVISVLIKRIKLSCESENGMVDGVLQMIDACLKADYTERATPADLLCFPFFSFK